MIRQQKAEVIVKGPDNQILMSWSINGTTFSGETSTTV
jgi:hypothetical protein